MDSVGPGKTFARAIVEIAERLEARRCSVTLRWTPAHRGVEGNEVAYDSARVASESACDVLGPNRGPQPSVQGLESVDGLESADGLSVA